MNKLNQGEQILLTGFTLNDLLLRIEEIIDSKLGNLPQKENNQSEYLSRQEVAKLLKITLPTLHDWTKLGLLKSYKIGCRVLYKKNEIIESVERVLSIKHKKNSI